METKPIIDLKIPFVFSLTLKNYGMGQGSFSIWFLIFGFYIAFVGGCGWWLCPDITKWIVELRCHAKSLISVIYIGIPATRYYDWHMKRSIKKMTPKQLKQFKDTLDILAKELE